MNKDDYKKGTRFKEAEARISTEFRCPYKTCGHNNWIDEEADEIEECQKCGRPIELI